jgi:hypothetical protein
MFEQKTVQSIKNACDMIIVCVVFACMVIMAVYVY